MDDDAAHNVPPPPPPTPPVTHKQLPAPLAARVAATPVPSLTTSSGSFFKPFSGLCLGPSLRRVRRDHACTALATARHQLTQRTGSSAHRAPAAQRPYHLMLLPPLPACLSLQVPRVVPPRHNSLPSSLSLSCLQAAALLPRVARPPPRGK